ncbi:hypothetical protein C1H46_039394 [Malus baccata]|uniref:MADS-box domain-containing protein n=1 Tax=Malus baccata TaxID=106549 RepID=A0A540KLH2_MALBA|nr:hypothetical protein C1H46_039394 [Malus baccata]
MGRRKSKLPLELIPNESSRKVTFRKRRNGLLKKAGDLKTLCDVKVCTIVYEKKSKGKLSTVATFPKEFKDVKEIIDKYKSNSSKVKRVQSLGDFYATQTVQVKKEIGKLRSKICEEKYPAWDDRFNAFSAEQMLDLLRNLENKIVAAHEMHSTMKESKQIVVQETIPPMAMFQSNQKYSQMLGLSDQKPSYCSMMMNDDWTQFASTSQTNNIQYTPPVIASNSICKISAWEHDQIFNDNYISAAYGNTDENATFYNPMQQQPCMYDSIFSSAAVQQQQQQAVVPSLENPKPIDALPLRTVLYEYDHPLSVTMQPSYLECPNSATSASSSEYDQKFAASHPQNMFYDDVFYDNLWHFE